MSGVDGRKPGPARDLTSGSSTNALRVYKSFYCQELGWEGVESCDFEECGYRARCQAQKVQK